MSTTQQHTQPWTEPPWCGWIETTGDALLILEAARRGLIPRVTRRLVDAERKMITSGSVFVFDEDESGIKRWTDGFYWSPSRILNNFLLYRETDKRGAGHRTHRNDPDANDFASDPAKSEPLSRPRDAPSPPIDKHRERSLLGSLTNSYKFKTDGLMKKTFSLTINGVAQHLISYYKIEDVRNGRLRTPSSLPELASLDISPEYLDKTHFRNPPKVEIGADGIPRYRGEADETETASASASSSSLLSPIPSGPSGSPTTTFVPGPPILTDRPLGSTKRQRQRGYTPPGGRRQKGARPAKGSQCQSQASPDANSPTSASPISPEDTASPLSPHIPAVAGPSSSVTQPPSSSAHHHHHTHAQQPYGDPAATAIPPHHYASYPTNFYQPYPPVYAHHPPPPPTHHHHQVAYTPQPQPSTSQAGGGSDDASSPRQNTTTGAAEGTTTTSGSSAAPATASTTTPSSTTSTAAATATTTAVPPATPSTAVPPVSYAYPGYAPHCSDPSQAAVAAPPPPPPGGGYYTYYGPPPPGPHSHLPHTHAMSHAPPPPHPHMSMPPPPPHTHGHGQGHLMQNAHMVPTHSHQQRSGTAPSAGPPPPPSPGSTAPGPGPGGAPTYQAYQPVSPWGAYPGYVHPSVAPPPPPLQMTHPHPHHMPPPPPHGHQYAPLGAYHPHVHGHHAQPQHQPHHYPQQQMGHVHGVVHPGVPGVAGAGAQTQPQQAPQGQQQQQQGQAQQQRQARSPADDAGDESDD